MIRVTRTETIAVIEPDRKSTRSAVSHALSAIASSIDTHGPAEGLTTFDARFPSGERITVSYGLDGDGESS